MNIIRFFLLLFPLAFAAQSEFIVHKLRLQDSAQFAGNEFSGLAIHNEHLYLLNQSEKTNGPWSGISSIPLSAIDKNIRNSTGILPVTRKQIENLAVAVDKINQVCGSCYDGLEAITVKGDRFFLAIETKDFAPACYILSGTIGDNGFSVDTLAPVILRKPAFRDGRRICNAGMEAMVTPGDEVLVFFEFNYFGTDNYCFSVNTLSRKVAQRKIAELPFRMTDATCSADNLITAINYFYAAPDGSCETAYRPRAADNAEHHVKKNGSYVNYCRLVTLVEKENGIEWEPLWTFPHDLTNFNWEGIAGYRGGYLIINDEYADAGKKYSALFYLERITKK
jgi:hypothetical protein